MSYPSGGWFAFPADLLILMRDKTADKKQDMMLMYIALRTWGTKVRQGEDASKEVHWALIPITDFVRELLISQRHAEEMIADLVERQLIRVKKVGQQKMYQLAPENWKNAPDYEVKADAAEADAAEADAAEADAAEADAAEADAAPIVGSQRLVARHGTRCKPAAFHLVIRGVAEPVKLRMEPFIDDARLPALEFDTTAKDGGLFRVSVRLANGEEEAKNSRTAARESDPNSLNSRRTQFRAYISELLSSYWAKPLDDPFFARIMAAANLDKQGKAYPDTLPLEYYSDLAAVDLAANAEAARKKRKPAHESSILVAYARQARDRFEQDRTMRRPAAAPAPEVKPFATTPDATPWPAIRNDIRSRVGEVEYNNWFADSCGVKTLNGKLLVAVPRQSIADMLTADYGDAVNAIAATVGITRVEFVGAERTA